MDGTQKLVALPERPPVTMKEAEILVSAWAEQVRADAADRRLAAARNRFTCEMFAASHLNSSVFVPQQVRDTVRETLEPMGLDPRMLDHLMMERAAQAVLRALLVLVSEGAQ